MLSLLPTIIELTKRNIARSKKSISHKYFFMQSWKQQQQTSSFLSNGKMESHFSFAAGHLSMLSRPFPPAVIMCKKIVSLRRNEPHTIHIPYVLNLSLFLRLFLSKQLSSRFPYPPNPHGKIHPCYSRCGK